MHKLPSFDAGTIVEWQYIHRATRLEYARHLIGRTISYRTYSMGTLLMNPPARITVEAVRKADTWTAGYGWVFAGTNEQGGYVVVPWNRIVEVIV